MHRCFEDQLQIKSNNLFISMLNLQKEFHLSPDRRKRHNERLQSRRTDQVTDMRHCFTCTDLTDVHDLHLAILFFTMHFHVSQLLFRREIFAQKSLSREFGIERKRIEWQSFHREKVTNDFIVAVCSNSRITVDLSMWTFAANRFILRYMSPTSKS